MLGTRDWSRRTRSVSVLGAGLLLAGLASGTATAQSSQDGPPHPESAVRLTWSSIANWVVDAGDTRVLVDAYYTRAAQPLEGQVSSPLFTGQGTLGLDYTTHPKPSDRDAVVRVLNALVYKNKKISYILTGHSNFDHSPDAPLLAKLTGATIIGSQTTCYQAYAEGIPASQCLIVNGGEILPLSKSLTVYVAHINHSGDTTTPDLHGAVELTRIPNVRTQSPAGGLRWGILEDMPNGGGGRAFLFKQEKSNGQSFTWTYQDTGSPTDFTEPIKVTDPQGRPLTTYKSSKENLAAAMRAAGVPRVDLMIASPSSATLLSQEMDILHPRSFLPTHWDGLWAPFFAGMPIPYCPSADVTELLAANNVSTSHPRQYMDRWRLTEWGVDRIENHAVKRELGFSDVQHFTNEQKCK